jgi:hypothetical protein
VVKKDLNWIQKETFEYAEKLARKYYKAELLGKSLHCNALRDKIKFTRSGWNHFVDKDRSINELITRFFALARVEVVLRQAREILDYEKRKLAGKNYEYWVVESKVKDVLVKVVICSINRGSKFFLSCIWKGDVKSKKELSLSPVARRREL